MTLQIGTVNDTPLVGAAAAWTLTVDADSATVLPVDYWLPPNAGAAGDRVLYDTIGGLVVVTDNLTTQYREWLGSVSVPTAPGPANTVFSVPITYPLGLFPAGSVPRVLVSLISATPDQASIGASNFTSTGATIYASRTTTGSNTAVQYQAVLDS